MGYTLNTMAKKNYWWSKGFIVDGNKVICTMINGCKTRIFSSHESAIHLLNKLIENNELYQSYIYLSDVEIDIESGREKYIYSYRYCINEGKLKIESTSVPKNEPIKFVTRIQEERDSTLHVVRKLVYSESYCNNGIYHGWDTRYRPDWILSEKNVGDDMVQCRYKNQKWLRPRTTYSDID